jgi:hypothetical protein
MPDEILSLLAPSADRRIVYGSDPNQLFDLRVPVEIPPKAGFPLAINIQGGFWRARYSLTHAGHLCSAFTNQLNLVARELVKHETLDAQTFKDLIKQSPVAA